MTFRARYPGRCAACEEPIRHDDEITYEEGQVVHADCERHVPKPQPICRGCFLSYPLDANGLCEECR